MLKKNGHTIQSIGKQLVLLTGILLIVLSSCQLRKALAVYFDVPIAKTLNPPKSGTIVSLGSCDSSDIAKTGTTTVVSQYLMLPGNFPVLLPADFQTTLATAIPQSDTGHFKSGAKIPFYILYRSFKYLIR